MSSTLAPHVELLTVSEVALLARVSPISVYRDIRSGKLAAVRPGGGRVLRVRREALHDWLTPTAGAASR